MSQLILNALALVTEPLVHSRPLITSSSMTTADPSVERFFLRIHFSQAAEAVMSEGEFVIEQPGCFSVAV
jgi:hypothetical protein